MTEESNAGPRRGQSQNTRDTCPRWPQDVLDLLQRWRAGALQGRCTPAEDPCRRRLPYLTTDEEARSEVMLCCVGIVENDQRLSGSAGNSAPAAYANARGRRAETHLADDAALTRTDACQVRPARPDPVGTCCSSAKKGVWLGG